LRFEVGSWEFALKKLWLWMEVDEVMRCNATPSSMAVFIRGPRMSIVESKMEMLTHLGAGTWAENTRENLTNQPLAFVEFVKQS